MIFGIVLIQKVDIEEIMSENGTQSWRGRLDMAVVDLRNEAIVQTANLYLLGRRVVLVGVGTVALGVDQVQSLLQHAVERGELVQNDTQQRVDGLHSRITGEVEAVKKGTGERLTTTVSSGVASLLNHLPGVKVVAAPVEAETRNAGDAGLSN
jgi:hypothetical protein